MRKLGLVFICLFVILFISSAESFDLPFYSLPATINGTTYQHGAISVSDSGQGAAWYYNQTEGQQLSMCYCQCPLPLNPTVYPPYDRWDIFFSEATFCLFDSSTTECTWHTASHSNMGIGSYAFIDGTGGQAYSDMDWVNTDAGLCSQGTLYKSANWTYTPPDEFKLLFPIEGYTPYSARVTSVLDHSVFTREPIKFYTKDSVITAFNGETGDRKCKNIYITATYFIRGCKNDSGTRFLNGVLNYSGGGEPRYLWYDGHPGYDYGVPKGTTLLASADGQLFKATKDLINSPRAANSWNKFHTFYIDHGNGYSSWYLHSNRLLPEIIAEITEKEYADVTQGQPIAKSGDYGTPGQNHLHFEVRKDGYDHANIIDPYKESLWE